MQVEPINTVVLPIDISSEALESLALSYQPDTKIGLVVDTLGYIAENPTSDPQYIEFCKRVIESGFAYHLMDYYSIELVPKYGMGAAHIWAIAYQINDNTLTVAGYIDYFKKEGLPTIAKNYWATRLKSSFSVN